MENTCLDSRGLHYWRCCVAYRRGHLCRITNLPKGDVSSSTRFKKFEDRQVESEKRWEHSIGVVRDKRMTWGGVIVPPEIHPFFFFCYTFKRCDYTSTTCAHTLPAAVIQFRRLKSRDKEIEGAKGKRRG